MVTRRNAVHSAIFPGDGAAGDGWNFSATARGISFYRAGDSVRRRNHGAVYFRDHAGESGCIRAADAIQPDVGGGLAAGAGAWRAGLHGVSVRAEWGRVVFYADAARRVATGAEHGTCGPRIFSDYMLPFEIASILLLVSMIGAVVMAKTKGIDGENALDKSLSGAEPGAVYDRRDRRGDAPQRDHHFDEHRADFECGEYQSGGVFAVVWRRWRGRSFAIFIITDAAAEAAVGLGIIIAFFRNRETVLADEMDLLKW